MSSRAERTFNLSPENAAFVDAQVASGAYVSEDDVLRAALLALWERDAGVERWLRDDVGPAYDAMQADPSRALSARSVFADIRAHHAARVAREA